MNPNQLLMSTDLTQTESNNPQLHITKYSIFCHIDKNSLMATYKLVVNSIDRRQTSSTLLAVYRNYF